MVVSGSTRPARPSHVAAAAGVTPMPRANAISGKATDVNVLLISGPPYGCVLAFGVALAALVAQPGQLCNRAIGHGDQMCEGQLGYCAIKPPSMTSSAPVTNEASSEARNSTP